MGDTYEHITCRCGYPPETKLLIPVSLLRVRAALGLKVMVVVQKLPFVEQYILVLHIGSVGINLSHVMFLAGIRVQVAFWSHDLVWISKS